MAKYIYQYENWADFTWDDKQISTLLAQGRNLQGRLLGKMSALGFSFQAEATLEIITLDVLKSSEIEGEKLNRGQVRSSIARRLGIDAAGLVTSARNIDGIVEMMLDATQRYELSLTEERMFGWHAALFPTGYSGGYKIDVACYRKGEMQVVSGAMGKEKVHYEAVAAENVKPEMDNFLKWVNAKDDKIDSVIKSAIAHLWFVTIHPFDDGNGRIARAISDMLLAYSDQSKQRFYSMSAQILKERKKYYEILEKTQRSVNSDITDWLYWFLNCFKNALLASEKILQSVIYKADFWNQNAKSTFNDRQIKVLNKLLDGEFRGKLRSSKWAKICKCSQDTAIRDIKDLIEKGILQQEQQGGRSTNYEFRVNYFDTAYIYGGSEDTLGTILAKNNLRDKVAKKGQKKDGTVLVKNCSAMKQFKLLILTVLLPLSGCTGIYNYHTEAYHRKVVVASFLHPDSLIKVTVSWNRPAKEESDIQHIEGALVQIEEDGIIILSGTTVNGVLSSQAYPLVGKHYRLKVMVTGEPELMATTSIPPPAAINCSIREKRGDSEFHEYMAVDVHSIGLPPQIPAVWITGYMKFDNGYVDISYREAMGKALYSNCPYLDQMNATIDPMDVLIRESNMMYEQNFIRIQRSAISLSLPFTFSQEISYRIGGEYFARGVWTTVEDANAEEFVVRLIAPSDEYDGYKRSAIKQELSQGIGSLFVNDPVRVYSNIERGVGIFAGYNTTEVAIPVVNPYKDKIRPL